jgi:chromosome segregation protein
VVFANNLNEAIELFNRNGTLQTIVTQNGDLISPQGIMLGGSKDKLNGILAKKQEMKELQRQCKDLDQKVQKAREHQQILDGDVRDLENRLQKLIEQKNMATQNEIEAEKTFYKISEDLKNANRHFEIVSLEQEQLLGETSDIDEEMTKYNTLLARLTDKTHAVQLRGKEITEKISAVSSEMEDFNQKVIDLKLKLTALNAKLENSNSSLRRLTEFYDDSQKRLAELDREIQLKNEKAKLSKQKIVEYEQSLSGMYNKVEQLGLTLETNEADYQSIDAELQNSDNLISSIQSKREKTLEKFRLLELELSQLQIKQENVANRLEERYQSSFSAIRAESNEQFQNNEMSSEMNIEEMETELSQLREKIAKITDVNLGAIREYEQLKDRYEFLEEQRNDLVKAIEDPAKLILTEPHKPLETGVELMIHLPGKKLTRLSLLSGGEKALSAIAFIFSIFFIRPASFCLLDEIDAPLDDANVFRFNDLLKIIGENSQIIMITHNKRSMEFADTLFGITMEEKGISKLVSVKIDRGKEAVAA